MHVFGATVCDFGDRLAESAIHCCRDLREENYLVVRILLTSVLGRMGVAPTEWAGLGWLMDTLLYSTHGAVLLLFIYTFCLAFCLHLQLLSFFPTFFLYSFHPPRLV